MSCWRTFLPGFLAVALGLAASERAAVADGKGWSRRVWQRLESAPIAEEKANPRRRSNASSILELDLRSGRRLVGVYKPRAGANPQRFTATISPLTYPEREVAAARLARAIGMTDLVPPTAKRRIHGEEGSVQVFVADTVDLEHAAAAGFVPGAGGAEFDRQDAERLRAFDYLIGSSDRAFTNILLAKDSPDPKHLRPLLIDNGQAFPVGPLEAISWQFPARWMERHTGPLLAETVAWIQAIRPERVASVLARAGLEHDAIVHTLRRLGRLQDDASFLEIRADDGGVAATVQRMKEHGQSRSQKLSPERLAKIEALVAHAERHRGGVARLTAADYYAAESVHLAELGGRPYDATQPAAHKAWLAGEGKGRSPRDELIRKIRTQVDRFAGTDRTVVARYFAELHQRQLQYDVPFGGTDRNVAGFEAPYDWALKAPVDQLEAEIELRVDAVFAAIARRAAR